MHDLNLVIAYIFAWLEKYMLLDLHNNLSDTN